MKLRHTNGGRGKLSGREARQRQREEGPQWKKERHSTWNEIGQKSVVLRAPAAYWNDARKRPGKKGLTKQGSASTREGQLRQPTPAAGGTASSERADKKIARQAQAEATLQTCRARLVHRSDDGDSLHPEMSVHSETTWCHVWLWTWRRPGPSAASVMELLLSGGKRVDVCEISTHIKIK